MKSFLTPLVSTLAITSLLMTGGAIAQNQKGERDWHKGPPSVEEKLARISEALDLSDEQSLEMLAVLQQQENHRQAMHDRTMELMGEEICAQRAQSETSILAILDDDQAELFLKMKEERKARAGDRKRSRKGQEPLDCSEY